MPAHPVGHREDRRHGEITIFVDPADAAGGGGGAMKEPGHCRSMTEDLNLCATKVRGEWCLAGRRLRTFRIKERRARMPEPGDALQKLGFLTIGLFDGQNPRPGHEVTLEMISLGERLGFDSAWVRHRHLQFGISSPVAVLAAAAQRTSRIELGTAVIPLGWENPLRLAEDLATVDVLSGGRLNPGVQHRGAAALGRRARRAVPRHRRGRGLLLRARGAAAAVRRRGTGRDVPRDRGVRAVLRPGGAALTGTAVPDVVRRRFARVGAVGRGARDELPHVERGAGRGVRRTSPRCSCRISGRSAKRTRRGRRRGCRRGSS